MPNVECRDSGSNTFHKVYDMVQSLLSHDQVDVKLNENLKVSKRYRPPASTRNAIRFFSMAQMEVETFFENVLKQVGVLWALVRQPNPPCTDMFIS